MVHLVCGVGVSDKGVHKAYTDGKHTKPYVHWREMLRRCYSTTRDDYKDVEIFSDWLQYQNFASWYSKETTNFDTESCLFYLDKDLLLPLNKIYGPENCSILPHNINSAIILPRGFRKINRKYHAKIKTTHKGASSYVLVSGYSMDEIVHKYADVKDEYVSYLAEVFKENISKRAFSALKNFNTEQRLIVSGVYALNTELNNYK